MSLWRELKRRNVFRVAAAYAVVGWLLIEVADTVFPRLMLPEWSVTLIIALLVIGFPVAVVFSWVFEITPEGIKREKDIDRDQSIAPVTGRRLDMLTVGAVVLALCVLAVDRFWLVDRQQQASTVQSESADTPNVGTERADPERSAVNNSIAVLPFANMSEDPGNEYFADGVAEELLNLLTRVEELRVISRSSSFSFQGENLGSTEIAERLNVAHILNGSVRKAGNRVRVGVQLVDARNDSQVWSQSYDRQLDDIFAIQDEIAASVVEQLRITLLGKAPTTEQVDPQAYQLYLQAQHLGRNFSQQALEESAALYRQALEIDPDYADAWAGLGLNFANRIGSGLMIVEEGAGKAREALENALAIDPDHAMAHSRLGVLALLGETDLPEAARRAERALGLAPGNVHVLSNAAFVPLVLGQVDRAIALRELVAERDPVSPLSHANLGAMYYFAEQWDKALAAYRTALRLSPEYLNVHFNIGIIHLLKGDLKAAEEAFARVPLEHQRKLGLALVEQDLGNADKFESLRAQWIENWGEAHPLHAAQLQAFSGSADSAFEWLDRAVKQKATELGIQFLEHYYDPIRDDPRWMDFLRRAGSAPEQREAIEFEITLPRSVRAREGKTRTPAV